MHGTMNLKFSEAKQTKEIYQYKNIKGKLYKTNAAIWYNKITRARGCIYSCYTPDDGCKKRPKHVE